MSRSVHPHEKGTALAGRRWHRRNMLFRPSQPLRDRRKLAPDRFDVFDPDLETDVYCDGRDCWLCSDETWRAASLPRGVTLDGATAAGVIGYTEAP